MGFLCSVVVLALLAGPVEAWSQEGDMGDMDMSKMQMQIRSEVHPTAQAEVGVTVVDCSANKVGGNYVLQAPKTTADGQQTDLVIKGITCVVDGTGLTDNISGMYVFRNVNILNGGTLKFIDATPVKAVDFHAHSILIERGGTLNAGGDSPIKGPLTIWLYGGPKGQDQTASITCQSDSVWKGSVCGIPSQIFTSNPNLIKKDANGYKSCTLASKVSGVVDPVVPGSPWKMGPDDCFYQYDVLDDGDINGAYFGRKALAVSAGGNLLLRGAKGIRPTDNKTNNCPSLPNAAGAIEKCAADSGTNWVRLNQTIAAGATSLKVDRDVSATWTTGDHIVVTATDFLGNHSEELVISGKVTSDATGSTIPVANADKTITGTAFPHYGQLYSYQKNGTSAGMPADPEIAGLTNIPAANRLDPTKQVESRAIVALLTHSIIVRSEGVTPITDRGTEHFRGAPGNFYGGHVIVRQGFSTFNVQGVEFLQLGQGGHIGRYPIHFHMARKVPQPSGCSTDATTKAITCTFLGTFVADSAIVDSMTRFITVHSTQGVTLARNVGFKSIGHGFYLEDATETDNRLFSNVGITARSGLLDAATNPRLVPGILNKDYILVPQTQPDGSSKLVPQPVQAGTQVPDDFPAHTDVNNPSLFWIQNTWNDIEYNAAVGAETCGACYWLAPAGISGPSVLENWTGYASMQRSSSLFGAVPLKNFRGNYCSTAMFSVQTIGASTQCNGVFFGETGAGASTDQTKLFSVRNTSTPADSLFPYEGGQRIHSTICAGATDPNSSVDCSAVIPCTGQGTSEANCSETIVDRYTTSFNFAPKNFSAIWMRGWWQIVQNSAITDQVKGGLTFISGGGYTRSDAAQGFWSVLENSVLVGHTQPASEVSGSKGTYTTTPGNPAANVAGPFNPDSAAMYQLQNKCIDGASQTYGLYCSEYKAGAIFINESFGDYEHLFNIYDGPAAQRNNIYSDINVTRIGNYSTCGTLAGDNANCVYLGFPGAANVGNALQEKGDGAKYPGDCYVPNAAIGWKQPNAFYYPPAFHSDTLVFNNVDIRHFVIQPLYDSYNPAGYYTQNMNASDPNSIPNTYCGWNKLMFTGTFGDIDRETELGDDDGTLTGLTAYNPDHNNPPTDPPARPSISVTKAAFNSVPLTTDECSSGQINGDQTLNVTDPTKPNQATVNTSPYEYLTLAMFQGTGYNVHATSSDPNFSQDCGNPSCYGVPLYRTYLTTAEMADYNKDKTHYPSIRMSGQGLGQRSALVLNHGSYYIDTTVSKSKQTSSGATNLNVFNRLPPVDPSINPPTPQNYTFFEIFGTKHSLVTYSLFIGTGADSNWKSLITPVRIDISDSSLKVSPDSGGTYLTPVGYDSKTGIATIKLDLTQQSELDDSQKGAFCQPKSYCAWNSSTNTCGCKAGSNCTDNKVCSYATGDIDCPVKGCFGFQVQLASKFPDLVNDASPTVPSIPAPVAFSSIPDTVDAAYFKTGAITYVSATQTYNKACAYPSGYKPAEAPIEERPAPWRITPVQGNQFTPLNPSQNQ